MTDEITPIDAGSESIPAVNDIPTGTAQPTPEEELVANANVEVLQKDSAEETDAKTSVDTEQSVEESADGEKVSELDKETTEDEEEVIEKDNFKSKVDEILDKPNLTKFTKSRLTALSKAFDRIVEPMDSLKSYGNVDTIKTNLDIFSGLDAVIPDERGVPTKSVRPFVEKLTASRGVDTVRAVMREFANVPSDKFENGNLLHELLDANGIPPTHLREIKEFVKNGYQSNANGVPPPDAEELEEIPEHLREAYASLSPDKRDEVFLMTDEMRDETLELRQFKLDSERAAAQTEAQEVERKQREKVEQEIAFNTGRSEKYLEIVTESEKRITTGFVESLVNTAQMPKQQAFGIASLINFAISGEGGMAAYAIEELTNDGIALDEQIPQLFNKWREESSYAAHFKQSGDETSEKERLKVVEGLEKELMAAANPIIAHYAKQNAQNAKQKADKRNQKIDEAATGNTGITPNTGEFKAIGGNGRFTPTEREQILNMG